MSEDFLEEWDELSDYRGNEWVQDMVLNRMEIVDVGTRRSLVAGLRHDKVRREPLVLVGQRVFFHYLQIRATRDIGFVREYL